MPKKIVIISILVILGIIALGYVFLYTAPGSRQTVRYVLSSHGDAKDSGIEMTGDIGGGMELKDIELTNLKGLPEGSVLKIQKLFIHLKPFSPDGLVVEVDNARLQLPESEPIVIMGSLRQQALDANIFSRGFTVNEVLSYLPDLKGLIPLKGQVNNVDLYVKGRYQEPEVTGAFEIETFVYKGFTLKDSFCHLAMQLKDINKDIKLFGRAMIEKGIFETNKTSVRLEPGYIEFSGPWNEPRFDLKGNTKIEKTSINISLKGAIDAPELVLSSVPPYSRQKLMVMLATGKSWQSVEATMDSGTLSADLTKDFIDYFIFAGKANKFAQRFGIRDVTVTFNGEEKGVGAKKDVTDKLEVGYAVEHRSAQNGDSAVSQKVGGEYKVTETLSVGVEKEVVKEKKDIIPEETLDETKNNDKVYIKYQKGF